MSPPNWDEIVATMLPRLTVVARSILRDECEAEDAVQDALLRAWRGIHSLRDPVALPAWLMTLARRAAIDRYHKLARTPSAAEGLETLPDRRYGQPEESLNVAEALASLSNTMRRTVELQLQGLSVQEVAAVDGVSVSAVKTRLSRARARVREQVRP